MYLQRKIEILFSLHNISFSYFIKTFSGYSVASIHTIYYLRTEGNEGQKDITFLEMYANKIVCEIKAAYKDRISSEEISRIVTCFIGYGLNSVLNKGFTILKGEIILLEQIVDLNQLNNNGDTNGEPKEIMDFTPFIPPRKYSPKMGNVGVTACGSLFLEEYDWNLAKKSMQIPLQPHSLVEHNLHVSNNMSDENQQAILVNNMDIQIPITALCNVMESSCLQFIKDAPNSMLTNDYG